MRDEKYRGPEHGPENEYDKKNHRPEPDHKKKKKKKRRKKHHFFLWILLLILIIGILLGILIDQGIIGFPGGKGWIGGAIGTITNQGQEDPNKNNAQLSTTPDASPIPTDEVVVPATEAHITVSKDKILMNGYELADIDALADQLNTDMYKTCPIILKDDYATKAVYDKVKELLDKNGRKYTEE